MADRVTQEVFDAFLNETVRVTRRLEIFESDGETLWMDSSDTPRMIDGSVTVDYGRDERRAIDLTLDNGDGVLAHDPDGFWYDKVLKTYKGIEYRNTRKIPSIAVLDDQDTVVRLGIIQTLREMGYVDIADLRGISLTADALAGYDIVVANAGVHSLPTSVSSLLKQVYANGTTSIFTLGNDNQSFNVPLIGSTMIKSGTEVWQVNKVSGDNPFAVGWNSFVNTGDTDNGQVITGLAPGVRPAAFWNLGATTTYSAIYQQNDNGARWFHYQASLIAAAKTNFRRFFAQALTWLYDYKEFKSFESQIGEFCIDRISEDDFPSSLKVTGRDYTKRLLADKFEQSVTFKAGTSIDDLVRSVAANGGVFKTLLNSEGAYLSSDVTFEREVERWKVIDDVCTANGVESYFNPQGYLTTRPFIDPTTAPVAFTLSTGRPDGNLVAYTKASSDAQVYNVVIVTSENQNDLADGIAYQGKAENHDPSSPTSIERLRGRRVYPYKSAFLDSQAAADSLALQLLKIHGLEEFELSFSSIAYPWLDVGAVAGFKDPRPGVGEPDRYLLTSLNIPLGLGPMSGSGKRITIIGGN